MNLNSIVKMKHLKQLKKIRMRKNMNALHTPFNDKLDATYSSVKKGSKETAKVEDFKIM